MDKDVVGKHKATSLVALVIRSMRRTIRAISANGAAHNLIVGSHPLHKQMLLKRF
jgi:hypothetical protein